MRLRDLAPDYALEKELVQACCDFVNSFDPPLAFIERIGQRKARGSGTDRGVTDSLVHVAGKTLCVEFKLPGEYLSRDQQRAAELRQEHGVFTYTVHSLEEFAAIVDAARKAAWR